MDNNTKRLVFHNVSYVRFLGANGLANPRDFLTPQACYDKDYMKPNGFVIVNKFQGHTFKETQIKF